MKGVKKLESLDQQDVKYIRDKLVRQLIEHKVITPMQDNVTRLIIPEK